MVADAEKAGILKEVMMGSGTGLSRARTALMVCVLALAFIGAFPAVATDTIDPSIDCRPIGAARLSTPAGVGWCPGVRPGGYVVSSVGGCTMNFVLIGSDYRVYIGTAGHCILETEQERAWSAGTGPTAWDGSRARIGEFAYAILDDRADRDYALIRVDEGVPVNFQMCHFGGPTGLNSDLTRTPTVLEQYGNGIIIGKTVPARTHIAPFMNNPNIVYANGAAIFGDSGSGVISDDGRAVGVLVHLGVAVGTNNTGTTGITRLGPQIALAQQALGIELHLQTAPKL